VRSRDDRRLAAFSDAARAVDRGGRSMTPDEAWRLVKRAGERDHAGRAQLDALVPELVRRWERGEPDASAAAFALGLAHMKVLGDDATAVLWFERAGECRDALGMLAYLIDEGRGAAANPTRATALYERAAELGDLYAQHIIGGRCEDGVGRPRDLALAIEWYRRAAAQGDPDAMASLGAALAITRRHDEEALSWYVRAAELGDERGAREAAVAYRDGVGTSRDPAEAARWYFALLWHRGHRDKLDEIARLMSELSDDDILRAATLAGRPEDGHDAIATLRAKHPYRGPARD
jgi:hypothetical protein